MSTQKTYCPACKKEVRFAVTSAPKFRGHANLNDHPQVVCLDFGQECPDGLCPRFGVPSIVLGVRLARSGEREEWETITGLCDACGQTAELEILDEHHAFCPLCQSTNRLVVFEVDGEEHVAITRKT
jgi:hypothetical protein